MVEEEEESFVGCRGCTVDDEDACCTVTALLGTTGITRRFVVSEQVHFLFRHFFFNLRFYGMRIAATAATSVRCQIGLDILDNRRNKVAMASSQCSKS
jgi:hypothetical protein